MTAARCGYCGWEGDADDVTQLDPTMVYDEEPRPLIDVCPECKQAGDVRRGVPVIYRCSERDGGCDEASIKRYAVTDHDGRVCVCDYCEECADLARADWNGDTASIVGPITDEHCPGCSAVVGGPVTLDQCSSLTHKPVVAA